MSCCYQAPFMPLNESNQSPQGHNPTMGMTSQSKNTQMFPWDMSSGQINGAPSSVTGGVPGSTLGGAQIAPSMLNNPNFIPGFLRTQIGKQIRVEFLIGTGVITDRIGKLVGVGSSYILLTPTGTDDILMADIYSIKFVTIYH